jgi:hypothetical protein
LAGLPIAITNRPDRAREVAVDLFAVYGTLPSYRATLDREDAASPVEIALVGDATTVEAGLHRLANAGVTDLLATPFEGDEGALSEPSTSSRTNCSSAGAMLVSANELAESRLSAWW